MNDLKDYSESTVVTGSFPPPADPRGCSIRILGIGNSGCNTIDLMIKNDLKDVDFVAINTDAKALEKSSSPVKVQIGVESLNGNSADCDVNKGMIAAQESREDIKKLLQGSDLVIVTTGLGGGTGSGAASIIADIAKELGALTVAVVTKPFKFEGKTKISNAESGISELSKHVDSIIVIDNNNLYKRINPYRDIIYAFKDTDEVLLKAVSGITDAINRRKSYVCIDFSDFETILRDHGNAMFGYGSGQGDNFIQDAVDRAIHSISFENVQINKAIGLFADLVVNPKFPFIKFEDFCNAVQSYANEDADCKISLEFDESLSEDQAYVYILATGIGATKQKCCQPTAEMNRFYLENYKKGRGKE